MDAGDIGRRFDQMRSSGSKTGNSNSHGFYRAGRLEIGDKYRQGFDQSIDAVDDGWCSSGSENFAGAIDQTCLDTGSANVYADVIHRGISMGYSGRPDKGDFNERETDRSDADQRPPAE